MRLLKAGVVASCVLMLAGCGAAPTNDPSSATSTVRVASLPKPIRQVLHFRDGAMCEDVKTAVEDAVGQGGFDGTPRVPGVLRWKTVQGKTTVRWIVPAIDGNVGTQVYTSGIHTFKFAISKSGKRLWALSGPSDTVMNMGAGCGGPMSGL